MGYKDYSEIACIDNLGKYKEAFCKLAEHYKKDLEGKIVIDGSVYTLHDFEHHCIDIYKLISEVIFNSKGAYSKTNGLTEMELYILDLAVLFHDISMSRDLQTERGNHSERSADYIEVLYMNKESVFYKEGKLSQNAVNTLKAIVKAHSDVKDRMPSEKCGLNAPELSNKMPPDKMRGKFLAGILRLADELDITSERLGQTNIESNLKEIRAKLVEIELQKKSGEGDPNYLQEKYEKYRKYVESLSHWEKLHLFSVVERKPQEEVVYLVTDDDYLQRLLDCGNTPAELARKITEVYRKIKKEWDEIKERIVDDESQRHEFGEVARRNIMPISEIKVKSNLLEVYQEIEKQLYHVSAIKEIANESVSDDATEKKSALIVDSDDAKLSQVQVIDEKLSNELSNEIKHRHLLKVGHFLLDEIFCARDWIDTKEIIETIKIGDKIVQRFVEHLRKVWDSSKKYMIIGLDVEGALLASRIAMGLKIPFSYIIPVRERAHAATKELEISIKEYDAIVLVTDAIVAYDTIKKALKEMAKSDEIDEKNILGKISQIYTIFYRENKLVDFDGLDELKGKTFCLNDTFPVELVKKAECHYMQKGECFALNYRVGLNN